MKLSEQLGQLIDQMRELDERQNRLINDHVAKTSKFLDEMRAETDIDPIGEAVDLLRARGWTLIPPKQ